jgi:hypothetical protein
MIVGPTTLAISPTLGPMNESTEPHAWFVVPPAGPFVDGVFEPQPKLPA